MTPPPIFVHFCRATGLLAILWGATACDTVMPVLVGKPHQGQTTSAAPQAIAGMGIPNAISDDPLGSKLNRVSVAPPTIQADPNGRQLSDESPSAPQTAHSPIAVTPLSSDLTVLSMLGGAALRVNAGNPDARFVLMILSPPAASAVALSQNGANAQAAADAVLKVLERSGVSADRVSVSTATSPTLPSAEMRLYQR